MDATSMQTPGDALSYITPIGESFVLYSPPTISPRAAFPTRRWLVAFYGEHMHIWLSCSFLVHLRRSVLLYPISCYTTL